jgi:hypothetical protein
MQQFYEFITWRFVSLNMFRAPPRPLSGAYNCINSLWFYHWSVGGSSAVGRGLGSKRPAGHILPIAVNISHQDTEYIFKY